MNLLSQPKRVMILKCLVEGMSMRATARVSWMFPRIRSSKLLIDAGKACLDYQDRTLRDLPCKQVQVDEIWEFVYAKQSNVPRAKHAPPEAGDVWTWVAIDASTKLVPSWRIGDRTGATAIEFMDDLRSRMANRIQLTSDGHKVYLGGRRRRIWRRRGLRSTGQTVR